MRFHVSSSLGQEVSYIHVLSLKCLENVNMFFPKWWVLGWLKSHGQKQKYRIWKNTSKDLDQKTNQKTQRFQADFTILQMMLLSLSLKDLEI